MTTKPQEVKHIENVDCKRIRSEPRTYGNFRRTDKSRLKRGKQDESNPSIKSVKGNWFIFSIFTIKVCFL